VDAFHLLGGFEHLGDLLVDDVLFLPFLCGLQAFVAGPLFGVNDNVCGAGGDRGGIFGFLGNQEGV
jgi:hypothetical protein